MIELHIRDGLWYARHTGATAAEIQWLFGAVDLPTAWTSATKPELVLDAVQSLHPATIVVVE